MPRSLKSNSILTKRSTDNLSKLSKPYPQSRTVKKLSNKLKVLREENALKLQHYKKQLESLTEQPAYKNRKPG